MAVQVSKNGPEIPIAPARGSLCTQPDVMSSTVFLRVVCSFFNLSIRWVMTGS